jgi:hypothetical protein
MDGKNKVEVQYQKEQEFRQEVEQEIEVRISLNLRNNHAVLHWRT